MIEIVPSWMRTSALTPSSARRSRRARARNPRPHALASRALNQWNNRMNELSPARINLGFVGFCAAVTGIGGFLFGYDTAVINGANTYLQAHFQLDRRPRKDWPARSAILGCIPGAMFAGLPQRPLRAPPDAVPLRAALRRVRPALRDPAEHRPILAARIHQRRWHRRVLDDLPGLHRRNRAGEMARPAWARCFNSASSPESSSRSSSTPRFKAGR